MRWFKIRKATIEDADREALERLGYSVAQLIFASRYDEIARDEALAGIKITGGTTLNFGLRMTLVNDKALTAWLTEQHDYEERRETWSLTMEAAITVFVLAELIFSVINFMRKY